MNDDEYWKLCHGDPPWLTPHIWIIYIYMYILWWIIYQYIIWWIIWYIYNITLYHIVSYITHYNTHMDYMIIWINMGVVHHFLTGSPRLSYRPPSVAWAPAAQPRGPGQSRAHSPQGDASATATAWGGGRSACRGGNPGESNNPGIKPLIKPLISIDRYIHLYINLYYST